MKMLFAIFVLLGFMSCTAEVCMSSTKFTAKIIQMITTLNASSTTPEVFDLTSVSDYDADAKMFSTKTTRFDADTATYSNFTVLQDFNSNKMFTSGPGFCNEQTLVGVPFFGACIPGNATHVRSYTVAGGQVTIQVYSGSFMGSIFYFHITDTGEPFMYTSYGQFGGAYQMDTQLFVDVRMGVLSDPNVFQTARCHGQSAPVVGK